MAMCANGIAIRQARLTRYVPETPKVSYDVLISI